MLIIPFETSGRSRGPLVLVMILEKENLDRMRVGDPFDIKFTSLLGDLNLNRPMRDVDLVIAYEEDIGTLVEFQKRRDMAGLAKWLERGRQVKPGDLFKPFPLRSA